MGGEFKTADATSEFGVDSEKIKGSDIHFMSDFDEVALSWINEEEGKFQSKKSITGFSDVSDIYMGKEEKQKRMKAPYLGGNSMPDDQGHSLETNDTTSKAIGWLSPRKKRIKMPYNQRIKSQNVDENL